MDMLITDALVVTCDEARRMLQRGAVAVRGNRIAAVGGTADLEREHPDLQRMSARGLPCSRASSHAHTHTARRCCAGRSRTPMRRDLRVHVADILCDDR
jgi:5-methylthioadenosine/S-adenosylhomocysteine deaminase